MSRDLATRAIVDTLRRARPMGIGRYGDEAEHWLDAARGWTGAQLDAAIEQAYEADSRIKSTTLQDPRDTLYSMLLLIAAKEAQ